MCIRDRCTGMQNTMTMLSVFYETQLRRCRQRAHGDGYTQTDRQAEKRKKCRSDKTIGLSREDQNGGSDMIRWRLQLPAEIKPAKIVSNTPGNSHQLFKKDEENPWTSGWTGRTRTVRYKPRAALSIVNHCTVSIDKQSQVPARSETHIQVAIKNMYVTVVF